MKTFSAYWTDSLGKAIARASVEPYPVECHNGADFAATTAAINQGIDSHLEAVHFTQCEGSHGRVRITFEAQSVPVLVRRLLESGDEDSQLLASDICGTLGIELI